MKDAITSMPGLMKAGYQKGKVLLGGAFDLLKSGGIMAFDDYKWCLGKFHPSKTPYAAVNALVTALHGKIETIHADLQYWIIKK